jgi:hypothetical protein
LANKLPCVIRGCRSDPRAVNCIFGNQRRFSIRLSLDRSPHTRTSLATSNSRWRFSYYAITQSSY